jgi:hypothetical protein
MRDPRDEIVMVDGKPMRRGDTPAFKRIWEEEVTGGTIERPDGTIVRGGEVVKPDPEDSHGMVVYECSGDAPPGAIDGSLELLSEDDRADTERMLAKRRAEGRPIKRQRIGGRPPKR